MTKSKAQEIFETTYTSDVYALPQGIEKQAEPYLGMEHDYKVTNKYDMRAVDELLFSIALQKRMSMPENGRLFIIMGENHLYPTHSFTQIGLLENFALAAKKHADVPNLKPISAVECSYSQSSNYLLWSLKNTEPTVEQKIELNKILEDDKNGIYSNNLGLYFIHNHTKGRKFSTFQRCYETDIRNNTPVIDVDAAIEGEDTEKLDPLSHSVAHEKGINTKDKENPFYHYNKDGFYNYAALIVRNEVMAIRTMKATDHHNAGVTIVTVGRDHITFHNSSQSSLENCNDHKNSLTNILADKITENDRIIAFYPTLEIDCEHDRNISPNLLEKKHVTTIRLSGLAEEEFPYNNEEERKLVVKKELEHIKKFADSYNAMAIPKRFKKDKDITFEKLKKKTKAIRERISSL